MNEHYIIPATSRLIRRKITVSISSSSNRSTQQQGQTQKTTESMTLMSAAAPAGKWPDAPEAFRKTKAALGVQLADELFTGFGLRAEASEDCIDVFADGFVFRLFLSSDRYSSCQCSIENDKLTWLLPSRAWCACGATSKSH